MPAEALARSPPDSWFSHLAMDVPGEDSSNEWPEAVDDTVYQKAAAKKK